jgi:hypothetical protein
MPERVAAGQLANVAINTPDYGVTWVGYGRITNFRRKTIGPPHIHFSLIYADLDGRTVAWPPEHVLEIEED